MSLKIVFIGSVANSAAEHLDGLIAAGHEVYAPGMDSINYMQTAGKICDADEVHIWQHKGVAACATMSFYLGMACMFAYANHGQFEVKLFNEDGLISGR